MKTWVFPSNPNHYNLKEAFKKLKEIDWRLRGNIKVEIGDTVYLYESRKKREDTENSELEDRIVLEARVIKDYVLKEEYINDREFWRNKKEFNFDDFNRWVRLKLVDDIFSDEINNKLLYKKLTDNGLISKMQGLIRLDNNPKLKEYIKNILNSED